MSGTGRCAVCEEGVAKYKCPRCLVQTCCLTCVKEHKVETECSGVRDKTAYVDKNSLTDMHLLSDYRFLEDAARKTDCANRDTLKRRSERPWHVNRLIHQARLRGVQLRVLPYPSTKRKENKSYFNNKTKAFSWHLEWIFPELNLKYSDKVAEVIVLESAMLNLLQSAQVDAVAQHHLSSYTETHSLRFLMKVEGRRADSPWYHALDPNKSVKENLAGKILVEYPSIHVVDREHCASYTVIGPDGSLESPPEVTSSESDASASTSESDNDKITAQPEDSVKAVLAEPSSAGSTETVLIPGSSGT